MYWKDKGKEVKEDFPLCDDKGFYALLKIGWDEVGELPVAAGEPAGTKSQSKSKTTGKRKKRGKKKKEEEEEEFDDEDESDEEPVPTADVIVDCLSEDESGAEEDMTQYYRVLDRPRRVRNAIGGE